MPDSDAAVTWLVAMLKEAGVQASIVIEFKDRRYRCRVRLIDGTFIDPVAVFEGHDLERVKTNVMAEEMEHARALAGAALRPSTLAAELNTSREEIVEAIAKALLPFIEAQRRE